MHSNKVNVVIDDSENIKLPKMIRIRQHFSRQKVENIEKEICLNMINKLNCDDYRGKRIAITAGSRGITDIDVILKSIVKQLKAWGAEPFIVPAMGSHGGANIEGQLQVLHSYNITEKNLGVPILASMEVVKIGQLDDGLSVFCDKIAYESDGIVVANKIKPHTDFKGDYESGLLKMMGIGLGKHKGASTLHSCGFDKFEYLIPKVAKVFLEKAPIACGVAILQNAYDDIMKIEVIPKNQIFEREKKLLMEAKENIARLMLSEIDVLIVEEIGKNISGSGMDANVTGRPGSGLKDGFTAPPIQKIIVLGVTKDSHGNGVGIGMADLTTRSCINQIDFSAMYTNSITATILNPSKIPMVLNNDKEAIMVAIKTCNNIDFNNAKIVKIKNTLELHEIEVSVAYLKELEKRSDITILTEPYEMQFTKEGKLV